jgi:phosphopantothenoylcysteine decarboxylase/phosphopantothenate--cysteine ligase
MIIEPATVDVIARLAQGRADDLLTTVALATPAPVAVAPAMNQQMWAHAATQENIQLLASRGIQIVGPAAGEQACGDVGPGRLLEPEAIVTALTQRFDNRRLEARRVVITAGPTMEAIDPVRYLSNHSSGKMGYALASACAEAGAHVELISGPVHLDPPDRVRVYLVSSAAEMCARALELADGADLFIGAAAVADYRPESTATEKIKKQSGDTLVIKLVENPDIIASVTQLANRPTLVAGFAAETNSVTHHAREKRLRKGLDMIIANDVSDPNTTFGSEQNAVHLITEAEERSLPLASKRVIAEQIVIAVADALER